MTTVVTIKCNHCEKSLRVAHPGSIKMEIYAYGWYECPDNQDEHYCKQCWVKRESENKDQN